MNIDTLINNLEKIRDEHDCSVESLFDDENIRFSKNFLTGNFEMRVILVPSEHFFRVPNDDRVKSSTRGSPDTDTREKRNKYFSLSNIEGVSEKVANKIRNKNKKTKQENGGESPGFDVTKYELDGIVVSEEISVDFFRENINDKQVVKDRIVSLVDKMWGELENTTRGMATDITGSSKEPWCENIYRAFWDIIGNEIDFK